MEQRGLSYFYASQLLKRPRVATLPLTPPDMRVRIRRFTESSTEILALDFLLSRAEDGSTLSTTPTGFTHFVCEVVPLSEVFGLPCSSCELLILLILSVFSPSRKKSVL